MNAETNKRQSNYDCGAYNIHWLLSSLEIENKVTDIVEINRKKMIPSVGVVPEVLVTTLNQYNIAAKLRTFRWLNTQQKKSTLKATLKDKPVILLIKRHGYLHFVLLTGFENETVHLYDPFLKNHSNNKNTIDNNGPIAGNNHINFDQLIQLWNKASVIGIYKNIAIIVEK